MKYSLSVHGYNAQNQSRFFQMLLTCIVTHFSPCKCNLWVYTRVEIEDYSVVYFDHSAAFEVTYH